MARYIDVDKAIGSINRILIEKENEKSSTAYFAFEKFKELLETAPTANVAPIADTVKKMQEMLKQTYDREHIETGRRFVSLEIVDLVAKEMLEEE